MASRPLSRGGTFSVTTTNMLITCSCVRHHPENWALESRAVDCLLAAVAVQSHRQPTPLQLRESAFPACVNCERCPCRPAALPCLALVDSLRLSQRPWAPLSRT